MVVKKKRLTVFQFLILIFVLIFTFYNTYNLHLTYSYPYHHDEWQHLGLSMQMAKEGYNKIFNPYLGIKSPHMDLESGFHVFISNIIMFTSFDPVLNYKYLAAIFSVLSGLAIFFSIYKLSDNFFIGILSSILFSVLRSNINILGRDYFVPMTMAIPFIFFFIYSFITSLNNSDSKMFSISMILLLFIMLIHPPSLIILIIPIIVELYYHRKFALNFGLFKKKKHYMAFGMILLIFLVLLWKGNLKYSLEYLFDLLYFEKGWGKVDVKFFVPLLYGLLNTFFVFIGFLKGYNVKFRFFIGWSLFSLIIVTLFNLFGFTIFVPYSRAIHYTLFSLIPLTAIGVDKSLDYIIKKFRVMKKQVVYIQILSCAIILFFSLNYHYELDLSFKEYSFPVVVDSEYEALLWFREYYGSNNTIITPYFMTSAVYPISQNKVISLIPAPLQGGYMYENLNFYSYDCLKKKILIETSKAEFVLSKEIIDCSYLETIYNKEIFIYEFV